MYFLSFAIYTNRKKLMQEIHEILKLIDGFIGGAQWFAYFLLSTGVFFTIYLKFPQIRYFRHALKVVGGKLIKAQSPNQQKMVDLMTKNDMLFAVGPAGTGKTYTAVALAVRALKEKEVKKLFHVPERE